MGEAKHGEGNAAGAPDDMGAGAGLGKIRRELGVTGFDINAIVLVTGGNNAYVGRDGQPVRDAPGHGSPGAAPS